MEKDPSAKYWEEKKARSLIQRKHARYDNQEIERITLNRINPKHSNVTLKKQNNKNNGNKDKMHVI